MDYRAEFSKRLILLREQHGITQQELADQLEITRQSLSLYEKAERTINIELLAKIADFFNVTTDYLMGRTEVSSMEADIQIACKVTGLKNDYIETLKAATNERINNKNSSDKTFIDAINALFYGITRKPMVLYNIIDLLENDIKLVNSEIDKNAINEINTSMQGLGVVLSHREYFEIIKQMTKTSFNDVVDEIATHFFTLPKDCTTLEEKTAENIWNSIFVNASNHLLEDIKESEQDADNNSKKE